MLKYKVNRVLIKDNLISDVISTRWGYYNYYIAHKQSSYYVEIAHKRINNAIEGTYKYYLRRSIKEDLILYKTREYINGCKHGITRRFYDCGEIEREHLYENGKFITTIYTSESC